jgi:hypothetical protein
LLDYCPGFGDVAALAEEQQRQVALQQELADLVTRASLRQQQCVIAQTMPRPVPTPVPAPVPAPTPAPVPIRKGENLQIPVDPKDRSFLEGCWKSISSLIEIHSQKPITATYCFDKNGKGTIQITGGFDCKGNVQATRSDTGGLKVTGSDQPACVGGTHFSIEEIECEKSDKQAACTGRPLDNSAPPYKVTIERQ